MCEGEGGFGDVAKGGSSASVNSDIREGGSKREGGSSSDAREGGSTSDEKEEGSNSDEQEEGSTSDAREVVAE